MDENEHGVECEDCGDECKRRKKCPKCEQMVCTWCWHHIHALELVAAPAAALLAAAAKGGAG